MFKNKEVRKLIYVYVIVITIFVIVLNIINNYFYEIYKTSIIDNNAYIIDKLVSKYPYMEEDIISSIVNNDSTLGVGYDILNKYGLDRIDTIDYLNNNGLTLKKEKIYYGIYIVSFITILFIILIVFIKKLYGSIKGLSNYTNNILNNKYDLDIRSYDEGDISNLKNDLYKMTIKLKEQSELSTKDKMYLQDMLSNISHQLKTPLTGMYVINELLYEKNMSLEKERELLSKNKRELERIEWLIVSLLKVSRIDSGTLKFSHDKIRVIDIIDKAIEPLKISLELKSIKLNMDVDNDIYIYGDLEWCSEAILNIIKNAIEHTNKNGVIDIEVLDNPIYTLVSIKDNGCGISSEDLPHIFERFYKGKHNKDSIGIGLNLSKTIINNMNGEILVNSTLGKETVFDIKFYKN
mgnify:FL=1